MEACYCIGFMIRNCNVICSINSINSLTFSRLLLDTFVCPSGILDIRFNNPKCQEVEKFAVATSSGSISLFTLKGNLVDDMMGEIVHLNTFQVFPESIVVTSLAWHSSSNGPIAVSTSDGKVSILNFCEDYAVLHQHAVINVHGNNEAWTVAFSMDMDHLHAGTHDKYGTYVTHGQPGQHVNVQPPRKNQFQPFMSPLQGVYSGGDDSLLRFAKFSRNKEGHTVLDDPASGLQHTGADVFGGHNAGVTAILPIPLIGQHILVTGSYDDYVRVYAVYDHCSSTEKREAKVLAELNIGGGIWRLTFLEDYANEGGRADAYPRDTTFRIMASCMQGGVRVLEVTGHPGEEWTIKVIAELKFNTTNDLVYAGDVQPTGSPLRNNPDSGYNEDGEEYVFVSANFYEKQLCVWKYYKPASPLSPKTAYLRSKKTLYGVDSTN
jgi:diphthine methyl ester acylhydrolase